MANKAKLKKKEASRGVADIDSFDTAGIRADFPILRRLMNGKQLVYLDNAATTQKPNQVIEALVRYYTQYNSNVHRAVHALAEEATNAYEESRNKTAKFIGSKSVSEIIFTRNATESLNLLAYSLGATLKKGDEIVSTVMEHHSNIVPWQSLKNKGVVVRYVDIDNEGHLRMDQLENMVTNKTKIVTVTHASNVLGTINDVRKISKIAHDHGALVAVDGAQSAPHMPVDVQDLGCDFFTLSGHKMLAPTGIGALWSRKELLEQMQPFMYGGEMIRTVTLEEATFNSVPHKFEAGTPNIADAIALGAAVDYLENIGMGKVRRHETELTRYALEKMSSIGGLTIYGPKSAEEKSGVIAFNLGDIHPHDMASILDEEGIAIRSGHACAMPLMRRLGCESVSRASFYIYNTKEEIDLLVAALNKAKRIFRIE
jgi:cysteine desulfurase/selenocysteine lyase